jgi:Fe-S cluster assembly iron-binding protein IscA
MQITPVAREKITAFLAEADGKLRVAQLSTGGCCAAKIQLGVTLTEEIEDDDQVLDVDGLEVVIDRALLRRVGEVTIDFCPVNGVVVRTCASKG